MERIKKQQRETSKGVEEERKRLNADIDEMTAKRDALQKMYDGVG